MANYKGGVEGAAGGALAGGSFAGAPGAVVGGVVGGLAGLFGGGGDENKNKDRQRLLDYYASLQGRESRGAPQIGSTAQADYSTFRDNQSNLIKHLEAMSQGRGPSLAAEQFKSSTDRNIAQQQALAQSGRGNQTAAAFQAANNSAQLGAQSAQDAGVARIAEQQMALNQLGLTLHGARGSDEDTNRFNAGQLNNTALANIDAQLKARGLDDEARIRVLGMITGGSANTGPGLGSQILAGGAGLYSMYATNKAANRGAGNA